MVKINEMHEKVYDISILLGAEQVDPPIPGVAPFSLEPAFSIKDGGACQLSNLSLNCHTGTHIDAPAHFVADSNTIDGYPVERFIVPAQVVDINDQERIRREDIESLGIEKGEALLFKTNNSKGGISRSSELQNDWVYLSAEAADACLEKGVSLIGIDYIAPEQPGGGIEHAPIHEKLLKNDILILESIALDAVPEGKYTLFCLPLKIKGAEASPVRAILIKWA
ncbi:MAG: cyclase family protein [Desulfobacteraceae bacterium]